MAGAKSSRRISRNTKAFVLKSARQGRDALNAEIRSLNFKEATTGISPVPLHRPQLKLARGTINLYLARQRKLIRQKQKAGQKK